jgi:hypothetical protein
MNAWKSGGMFEGGPATDERVLAHWQGRLAGVDPKDPLYDTYKNLVFQYEYAIASSKQSTLYAQGKIGNAAMARFYLDWAKKVPKDSEFYRVLQRDAAQFMRASRSGGGGGGGSGGTTAFNKASQATYNKYEAPGDYLTGVLTGLAQANGLVGMNEDLTDFRVGGSGSGERDPGRMMALIGEIMENPGAPLYQTADGIVTGQMVLDQLRKLDPDFSGNLTADYYNRALGNQRIGLQTRLDLANKGGFRDAAKENEKKLGFVSEIGRETGIWDTAQLYVAARDKLALTWDDPTASPTDRMAAAREYGNTLASLATDATNPVDIRTANLLQNEVAGVRGDPNAANLDTLWENLYGFTDTTSGGGNQAGDNTGTVASIQRLQAQIDAVATGEYVWGYGVNTNDGFRLSAGGNQIGAVPVVDAVGAGAKVVAIPQRSGGALRVAILAGDLRVTATDVNGNPLGLLKYTDIGGVPVPSTNVVGKVYRAFINGFELVIYSWQHRGETIYSEDPPFDPRRVGVTSGPDGGLLLDITQVTDVTPATYTKNFDGTISGVQEGTFDPTKWVNPERDHASFDKGTDSRSLAVALLMALPDGQQQFNDPEVWKIIEDVARNEATRGGVFDQGKYDALLADIDLAINGLRRPPPWRDDPREPWRFDKKTTALLVDTGQGVLADEGNRGNLPGRRSAFDTTPFAPLAAAFRSDAPSLLDRGPRNLDRIGVQIKTPLTLTVPAPPPTVRDDYRSDQKVYQPPAPPPPPVFTPTAAVVQPKTTRPLYEPPTFTAPVYDTAPAPALPRYGPQPI